MLHRDSISRRERGSHSTEFLPRPARRAMSGRPAKRTRTATRLQNLSSAPSTTVASRAGPSVSNGNQVGPAARRVRSASRKVATRRRRNARRRTVALEPPASRTTTAAEARVYSARSMMAASRDKSSRVNTRTWLGSAAPLRRSARAERSVRFPPAEGPENAPRRERRERTAIVTETASTPICSAASVTPAPAEPVTCAQ